MLMCPKPFNALYNKVMSTILAIIVGKLLQALPLCYITMNSAQWYDICIRFALMYEDSCIN